MPLHIYGNVETRRTPRKIDRLILISAYLSPPLLLAFSLDAPTSKYPARNYMRDKVKLDLTAFQHKAFSRPAVFAIITTFFSLHVWLNNSGAIRTNIPFWVGMVVLTLGATAIARWLSMGMYVLCLILFFSTHPWNTEGVAWGLSFGALLVVVNRLKQRKLSQPSSRMMWPTVFAAFISLLVVAGIAGYPSTTKSDLVGLLFRFTGAFTLALQCAPLLLKLLFPSHEHPRSPPLVPIVSRDVV